MGYLAQRPILKSTKSSLLILLAIGLMVGTIAKADPPGKGIHENLTPLEQLKRLEANEARKRELEGQKLRAEEEQRKIDAAIAQLEKQAGIDEKAFSQALTANPRVNPVSSEKLVALREKWSNSYESVLNQKTALSRVKGELATINSNLSSLSREISRDKTKTSSQDFKNDVTNARLDALLMTNEVANLQLKNADAQASLNAIEKRFANEAIGLYVRDKIGKLVNSQFICEVGKRCALPKDQPKEITPDKIEEIFPEMKASSQRAGYHPGVPKNGGAAGAVK